MICKWCGAAMERSHTVCRRCGKEAPAMSDCGGFYDLVPQAQQAIPVADLETGTAPSAKKTGLLGFLCVVLAILLTASVVACVMISADKKALAEEVEELEELLEEAVPAATGDEALAPERIPTKEQESTEDTESGETQAETEPGEATEETEE